MAENYKEIIEKINKSFEEGDTEGFLSECTDDFAWVMVGEESHKGKESIRSWMSQMKGMEPPKISSTNVIADGENVAAHGEMTMKNESGETVNYEYCDVYRFEDGKVAELRSYVIKTK